MKDSTNARSKDGENDSPKVYAIKRSGGLWTLHRRDALKAVAGATGALVVGAGCDTKSTTPSEGTSFSKALTSIEFSSGSNTFRLVDLKDYNGAMPSSGTNLFVVGYVVDDFFFRNFDSGGEVIFNKHESHFETAVDELTRFKSLVREVKHRGRFEPSEEEQFAEMVSTISHQNKRTQASSSSGRRMQGSAAEITNPGRRMQNAAGAVAGFDSRSQDSAASATTAGRRMQGALSEATSAGRRMQGTAGQFHGSHGAYRQNYGDIVIGTRTYHNLKIVGVYSDGTCQIQYAGGSKAIQVTQLSELVRMQLPPPISRPASDVRASTETTTSHETTISRPTTTTSPTPSYPSRTYSYSYHYWRPN